jgi:hypothetical protein
MGAAPLLVRLVSMRKRARAFAQWDSLSLAKIGPGRWADLSSPPYTRALGFEATRGAWRRISSSPLPRRDCCLTKSLSPHAPFFIAEVPPLPIAFSNRYLGPRASFSTTNPSPIGPGLWGILCAGEGWFSTAALCAHSVLGDGLQLTQLYKTKTSGSC